MLRNLIRSRLQGVLQKRPPGIEGKWGKRVLILVGFILALLVLGHLGVRFLLWPQIEKSKPALEKLISTRIGTDVSMDDVQVSWTGIRPSFAITGLRFNNPSKIKPLLEIQKISGELSWVSFYHLEPYFHELNFDGAQIYAQRNVQGIVSIAGIPIGAKSDDFSAENWLFAQNTIKVTHAQFFWQDLQNKKLNTFVDIQEFSLSNGLRKHDSTLLANTPWHKGQIQINANFVHRLGGQAGNWRDWIGEFSWDFADLNLNQITKDFKVPFYALEGKVSSQGQINLDRGKPDGGALNIRADQLKIQLNKEDEAIEFGRLETDLVQATDKKMLTVSTKSLAWRDIDSPSTAALDHLSPITFRWKPPKDGGEIKEFGFSSPEIMVEDLARFALNLPLPKKIRQWIKTSEADGELQDIEINWAESQSALAALPIPGSWFNTNKLDFTVSAKLIDLSFVGINKSMPTVSHLSGSITSDQKHGSLSLASSDLEVEINGFLVDPLIKLDRASGQISWEKYKGGWSITANQVAFSNPEINATLTGNYILGGPKQADQITLDMNLAQAKLTSAYRYLPVGMNADTQQYLSKAFDDGLIRNGSVHIKGDPNQIPFPNGQLGEFSLNLPISDATFKPAPLLSKSQGEWSPFTKLSGQIKMTQSALSVEIVKANYQSVALNNIHVEIPNVSAKPLMLSADGSAQGNAQQMLQYLFASPVGKNQEGLEKNLKIAGSTTLNLDLKLPLSGKADTHIDAKLDLPGNRVQWGSFPPLDNLKGKIRITEANPAFENVTANFLGGDINITSVSSSADKPSFSINGNIDSHFIKQYFSKDVSPQMNSLLKGMSGTAKYEGLLNFSKTGSDTNLKFDLSNWASQAPAPAKKVLGTPMLGQIHFRTDANSKLDTPRLTWSGKIGEQISLQGSLDQSNDIRYALGIGTAANLPQQGFALNLQASELNLDAWQEFLSANQKVKTVRQNAGSASDIQVTAQIKKLVLLDRAWTDVSLLGSNRSDIWQLRINSSQTAGQIRWQEESSSNPSGLITGRINRLKVPEPISAMDSEPKNQNVQAQKSANNEKLNPNSVPSLDLTIDDFSWSKAQLGTLKIKTHTSKNLLTIDSIRISNPQGNSALSGQWIGASGNGKDHSLLKIDMDVKDAGQIIAHWSSAQSVEGGQGKLDGKLEWDGNLLEPDYATLSGKINLNLIKGRLLEVNSDAAKILDVLSLQSLFRFATLDLQGSLGNIVTKGTPFNSIESGFDINAGIAQTNLFTMELDQARVVINGQINIPKETQDLRVTVFPTIDAAAGSVVAAFVINPIVGLSALVGQYLITNQINRAMQTDYLVQGSWADPEVIPLDQKGQPIDSKTLDNIRSKSLLKEQVKPSAPNAPTPASPLSPPASPQT